MSVLDHSFISLLFDFGQFALCLGASFLHLNNGGREEFIFVLENLLAEISRNQ